MKRFAYYIACCTLVVLCACTHDDTDDVIPAGNGKITIQASLDDMAITRADVKDTQAERKITHIDVFAVDSNGDIDYYERNTAGNNNGANDEDGSGVLTLNVARRAKSGSDFVFAQDEEYKFYLVANATAAKSEMEAIKTLAALQQLVQNDSFIPNETGWTGGEQTLLHLTGTTGLGVNPDKEVPETFLMDAVATDAQSNDAFVVNSSEGNLTNLNLSAEFKRAAAKIIVNITQGEDVEFRIEMIETNGTSQTSQTSQYDFIELPASTFVLPSDENLVGIKRVNTNPMVPNDQTFVWASEKPAASNSIQVVGYAYAHFWDNANLKNETSLILNIPMMWNQDDSEDKSKEEAAPRSWYKVPLSKDKKFERNRCYVVNVTINAVGATNRSTAIELENIEYKTLDWVGVNINVGNDVNRPAYLELNTDLVEIYNANFDNTSLSFSSSSAITSVKLKDIYTQNANGTFTVAADSHSAYYINKFGIYTDLSSTVRGTISATAEQNVLNGGISILSPILKTTDEERRLAIEALGEAPKSPTAVAPPSGMPEPTDYLGEGKGYPIVSDRPNASSSNHNDTFTVYRYDETTGKFQKRTDTCTSLYGIYYYWAEGTWEDIDAPQAYVDAYDTWVANNAENVLKYQQYLEAKERYDAYNTAKTAIENSGNVAESHYNTIRYLEFEVKNADGLTATFRVMQYPVIYITNIQGWYSYRDDFGGTTYENKGTGVIQAKTYNQENDTWTYETDTSSGGFWNSKVAKNYDSSTGKSRIECYYWNGNSVESLYGQNSQNAKMYYVRVTASSGQYTIGRPRIVDGSGDITTDVEKGTTEASAANNKLVSPSFMIASRLGYIWSGTLKSKEMAVSHCKQYVEVHKDPATGKTVTYRDWRLPTTEEIKIIISLQGAENENDDTKAIDFLLNADAYYSAEGPVSTSTKEIITTSDASVRCIRDAYDNE